ncbi:MAG: BMP family ABC transporter substrate-binding protein [Oscillospiraceae bacterium]|jgi:basic membrane lipoprotein Med (substrate-binding protein (PBP1-ABC) superfamily)|nr:BMP family ABC transporter substrate-binding protein [Oscillospiraceae bacterium]
MPDIELRSEARTAYINARKLGRKYLSDNGERDGYLPVLDEKLRENVIVGEINMGRHEISLSRVIGTKTAGRSTAFAGNFMPLLEPETEFGAKWQNLYVYQLRDGIQDAVTLYEFLGNYYVQEGNKRVSVLLSVGASSIYANVIRYVPERRAGDDNNAIYYELLDYDKRAYFDNLWFTKRGAFTALVAAVEIYLAAHPEVEASVTDALNEVHAVFRQAYKPLDGDSASLTTGDALTEYSGIFGFPYGATAGEIYANLKIAEGQLRFASGEITRNTIEVDSAQSPGEAKRGFFSFAAKQQVKIAVAYEGNLRTSIWSEQHDRAIRGLEEKYGDRLIVERYFNIPQIGELSYRSLKRAAAGSPDILFTTRDTLSAASLRYSLEHPETTVLNCDTPHDGRNLHTYFCKMYDLTFLVGIVAGALSETSRIGFMTPPLGSPTYDLNAFAVGARLVNPRSTVINIAMNEINNHREHNAARKRFADRGCDLAFCLHSPDNPQDFQAEPTIYAQLYSLDRETGVPLESIARATLDWEPFYDKVISDYLGGRFGLLKGNSPIHFGWGFQTGIMDLLTDPERLGVTSRLLRIFRDLLKAGGLHPFEGPISDNNGVRRIDYNVSPTLQEIQEMTWYAFSVNNEQLTNNS